MKTVHAAKFLVAASLLAVPLSYGESGFQFSQEDQAWMARSRALLEGPSHPEQSPRQAPSSPSELYTVFVSESMGDPLIREAIRAVGSLTTKGVNTRLVVRGMLPGENLASGMRRMALRLRELGMEHVAFEIDPPAFRDNLITEVPTILRQIGGSVTDRVVGTVHPQYLVNRRDSLPERHEAFTLHDRAGETQKIAEVDLIVYMQEKIAQTDWGAKKRQAVDRHWRNKQYLALPRARHNESRVMDPGIRVDEDYYIDGKLVYAKGTELSPFDAIPMVKRYLVFNATREVEVAYAEKLMATKPAGEPWVLMATEFPREETMERVMALQDRVKGPIYLLDKVIAKRFTVKATPTTIVPDSNRKVFEIKEVAL